MWSKYKAAGRSNTALSAYKQSCLEVSKLVRAKIDSLEANLIKSNNLGAFYRYVNKRIKCKSTITPLRNPEGQLCFGDDGKASLLNNYFASVGTVDNGNIQPCISVYDDQQLGKIVFTQVNVEKAIGRLKNNLSSGPDNIPPLFYTKLKMY